MTDQPSEDHTDEERKAAREATLASVLNEDAELMRRLAGTPPGPAGSSDSIWRRIGLLSTEVAWLKIEAEHGMLTEAEVRERGADPAELLGVQRYGSRRFPGWQVGLNGALSLVERLREAAERFDVDQESALMWMNNRYTWWELEGGRAVDHLDEPDEIIRAFESHFGVEW